MCASTAWCLATAAAVALMVLRPFAAVALVVALFAYARLRTAVQSRRT